MDWVKALLEYGSQVVQSPFATALILLALVTISVLANRQMITRVRQELRMALLECRKDELVNSKFLSSALNIAGRYEMLLAVAPSDRRQSSPEAVELREDYHKLRREVHDEVGRRADRLATTLKMVEGAHQAKGLL